MNDLIKLLRGQRIDGRSADEIMRLAADEIESLQSQLSYRIEERDDSNRNLTAALRREVASKDRLAEAEALLLKAEQNELLLVEKLDTAEALLREAKPFIIDAMDNIASNCAYKRAGERCTDRIDAFLGREP